MGQLAPEPRQVNICVDTNVLLRAIVDDNPKQARIASKLLREADAVHIPLVCICEFAWVLRSRYGFTTPDIYRAISTLLNSSNVFFDQEAAEAGLAAMREGYDFADAVIMHQGYGLGGETFMSFDKDAVAFAHKQGLKAKLL